MNCIIVDDEPLAREGIQLLVDQTRDLDVKGSFSNTAAASKFLVTHPVDLIFLDIQMPGVNGIDFARTVPPKTLVIFTTAFTEYAIDSYEVEAIDYLVKPIKPERFQKAVSKAFAYQQLLQADSGEGHIGSVTGDYFFIKSERKVFKVHFKEILFIEGLKDYVIVHTEDQRIITAMNIKTIHDQLPRGIFVRISKSYVINVQHIASFDNNTVVIRKFEIPIGSAYRAYFFDEFVAKRIISR